MNYQVNGEKSVGDLLNGIEANFLLGEKNIAISSTHYHSLQQKLILLALYHFNTKYPHLKMGAISFSCDNGDFKEFSDYANATTQEGVLNFSDHFDLISWDYLIKNKLEKSIGDSYDILIWELPEIEQLAAKSKELQDSLANIHALFIISNRLNSDSDREFAASISQYFINHGVDISQILPIRSKKQESSLDKIKKTISEKLKKAA